MTYHPSPRTIAVIVGLIALVLAAAIIPGCVRQWRSEKAQTRIDAAQATAAQTSAGEASQTQSTVNANEVESEALGRSNEKDIRNAEGSDAPVAAPAGAAGIRALCMRRVYRDTERCRLFNAR